jgi:FlaG/FlaF family flagellin (archaellin)
MPLDEYAVPRSRRFHCLKPLGGFLPVSARLPSMSGGRRRAVSSVMATVMMVALVVILSSVVTLFGLGFGGDQQPVAPQISVSDTTVTDGAERSIAVTLQGGAAVATDQLYVRGSTEVDIGGAPDSGTPANEAYASDLETFTESSGSNPPQVGIGETWDAGETIYLDPVGSVDGVTIRIYWNTKPVRGVNPGTVEGQDSYEIAEFTVRRA